MTTILIVDDEATIADLLRMVLEDAGYQVIVAANGSEALAELASTRPALIITDAMMPGMTGQELARAIHDDQALSGIPVVLTSAAPIPDSNDGLWKAALPKPWRMEQLLALIAALSGGPAPD